MAGTEEQKVRWLLVYVWKCVCTLLRCLPFTYKYPNYTPRLRLLHHLHCTRLFFPSSSLQSLVLTVEMTMRLSVKQILAALVAAAAATCAAALMSAPLAYYAILHVF